MADRLTQVHRQAQNAIKAQASGELLKLWPAMDWTNLDTTFPAWVTAAGAIITHYRATSTATAVSYLRRHRLAAGVPGVAPIVRAGPLPGDQVVTALATTALWGVKAAAARGVLADQAMANAYVRSSGAATRLILDGGRTTLTETMRADPRIVAYQRVTSGNACNFCEQVAEWAEGNDALNSEFEVHDHCGCTAEPVYS